jgi:chromosome segregation protein
VVSTLALDRQLYTAAAFFQAIAPPNEGLLAARYPQGDRWASAKVKPWGAMRVAGKLGSVRLRRGDRHKILWVIFSRPLGIVLAPCRLVFHLFACFTPKSHRTIMYLKSLEILGFKSFAPKTVLHFDPGVTCVVGPNGCGKSNVLDAIRWVLGEQSAKALRGGEMTDVIFSGTDSRAALGMAEVSMTFSECEEQLGLDWHEVTITRRVFREGGSEYLLNKTPCRLKDIHALFMDTGIGRSAYSIMEQGKIDLILSSRPEDRRAIFEEAAGITKYKFQRREALRKLEATEANLVRLADIVKEVKRQIGSVQRQAAKARRYQGMLEDLRILETHSAKRQWDELDSARAASAGELEGLSARQMEIDAAIEAEETTAHDRRTALEEMEGRLAQARQAVQDLHARIANHESRMAFNSERAVEFAQLTERYRADISGSEEKFVDAEARLREADTQIEQITAMLATELHRMEEVQAQASGLTAQRQEADSRISALANDAGRIESKLGSLRSQIATATQQHDGAEARLAVLASDVAAATESLTRLGEQQSGAQAQIAEAIRELEAHTAAEAEAGASVQAAQEQLSAADREVAEAQRALSEKSGRLDVLRQLADEGEGFNEGTQAVLRGLDNPTFFQGAIAGALTRFIAVEPEFVSAIEAALGQNLQAVLVKDTMVAESMVKTLASKKWGRATLLLRELLPTVQAQGQFLPDGAIAWALDKVRVEDELRPLLTALLADFVIVEHIDAAFALQRRARAESRRLSVVTLSGEVLTADGALIGGTPSGTDTSVLQRKNQILALDGEVAHQRAILDGVTARRVELQSAMETAQARLAEAREEKQTATVRLGTLRGQLQVVEAHLAESTRKREALDWEQQSAEARRVEAAGRIEQFDREVRETMQAFESMLTQRTEAQNSLETLRAQESEIASELNDLKIKVATERQRHSSLHHQRQPMEARMGELRELIDQRKCDIRSYEDRSAALEVENAEIEASVKRLGDSIGEATQRVAELQEERASVVAAAEEMAEKLRHLRRDQSHCVEQRGALEVRATQLELKAGAINEHIEKRYQMNLREFTPDGYALQVCMREIGKRIRKLETQVETESGQAPIEPVESTETLTEAESAPSETIDWMRIETLVKELDTRLAAMGPVNLDAIAEFEELEQRYNFLEQQVSDTTAAKDELIAVINKINETTRTLFADTFEKVRVNFQEMFRELFGGGQANLVLTDDADPLECGIEIIAKPPGKQLQSISLLSGGEKTMTAVALLFSIYMVKPSPFCVLDEMDAPLDESNISRFIKILDRFVAQSQFVVISHNKRTIARADALYGVTMEEHGVSKLVGVKFRAREDAHERHDILGADNPTPTPSIAESFGKHGNLRTETLESANGAA